MTKQDQRKVYDRLREQQRPEMAEKYVEWVKSMNECGSGFEPTQYERGVLVRWMTSILKSLTEQSQGSEPRYYFIAALTGEGGGTVKGLTDLQIEFLLDRLTSPVEDGYVINTEGASIAKAITAAAIDVLKLPLEPKSEEIQEPPEPEEPPEPQESPEEDEEEGEVETKSINVEPGDLPHFKTVSMSYEYKFSGKKGGDYHSVDAQIGVWFDVPEDDNPLPLVAATWAYLKDQVKQQTAPVVKHIKRTGSGGNGHAPQAPAPASAAQGAPAAPTAPPTAPPTRAAAPPPPTAGNGNGNGKGSDKEDKEKSGTHPVTKITVDAEGALSIFVNGMRWPFTDKRGPEVYAGHFDPSLGWTAAHFYPGALYQGEDVAGLKLYWEKHGKYYDIEKVFAG